MKLRYGTVLLLGLFHAAGLGAAELRVADMWLAPDAAWQRGAAEQERADDAFLLEQPGAASPALQVLVPRQAARLKGAGTDAEREQAFYRKLTRSWQAQYGRAAAIGWTEAGGRRWLTCRRPGRDAGVRVFHLATVHQERAYSLLVFASDAQEHLPAAVHALAAQARFGPPPLPPPPRWALARTYRAQPDGATMDALVQGDAQRLAGAGMLTGYGLEYGLEANNSSLDWFLEGFRWQGSDARAGRRPFILRGHLQATPPATLRAPAELALGLEQGEGMEGGGELLAQVRVWRLCAPDSELEAALAPLDQGERAGLERIALEPRADCPATPARLAGELRAGSGQRREQSVALEAPASAVGTASAEPALLVEVALLPAQDGEHLGDALLRRAGLFFLYRPAP